ncbi:hypothetical protein QYF36_009772 [Acer negundo]|nr:hypothetical protein QYF36_009772 [Acer negundo]
MDKSWIRESRRDRDIVKEHMICDGLDIGYFSNIWIYHGELDYTQARLKNEQPVQVDDMHGMLGNAFGVLDDGGSEFDGVDLSGGGDDNNGGSDENIDDGNKENLNDYTETFYNLLKDVEQELYLGLDVIELDYYGGRKLALFKCDWIDINSNRGTKKDELGFTPVNPSCLLKTKELFILASQEIQIFYIKDPMETDWHDVVFTKPRDLNDMDEFANVGDLLMENESDNTTNLQQFMDNKDDVRDNVLEIMLNSPVNIVDVGAENNDSDDEDEDEYDN